MPRYINTHEFNIERANLESTATPQELITKIRSMPSDLDGASTLRPLDLYAFISRLNNTESVAVNFNK